MRCFIVDKKKLQEARLWAYVIGIVLFVAVLPLPRALPMTS